jgi:hypothetical protein
LAPLSSVGIPSVSFSRKAGIDILRHSTEDMIGWLNHKALQVQGRFVERFLTKYVAEAAAFPFDREIPNKLHEKIIKYKVASELLLKCIRKFLHFL